MNNIRKQPVSSLGFGFIEKPYLPKGKDEYYLRNRQHRTQHTYRKLNAKEIQILLKNDNSADDWNHVEVADPFDVRLIKRCSFFGRIRIGNLQPFFHEFNNLRMPVGLYNSTLISCDLGDNVVVDQISFMSHYIVGNDVMLVNIKELSVSNHTKFGNGIVKEGEDESVRIWMEICNENGGRKVLPFNGMLAGDAWIWSKYRSDRALLEKFKEFTDDKFDRKRGYYGKIGERTVIKNCDIIKDVWIGSDAYIKGANKLKNLTISSDDKASTQIGEGCEMVNGIIGVGCRIFYGVKAVRFIMGSHSQLKYGARLINSYLGDNSTISCCEVLNSLIFPGHEQHHNNSFLCAAVVQGQSNMAAGATIGSNHNSRAADGELVASRGFWPALCVSIKHNSIFSAYTMLAKGDYPYELHIPLPFSMVSNQTDTNELSIIPGYWFLYNFYALARNSEKYSTRDQRIDRSIYLEYDYLAPDTINELFAGLSLLQEATGKAYARTEQKKLSSRQCHTTGAWLLEQNPDYVNTISITVDGFENGKRKVVLLKTAHGYHAYKRMIVFYAIKQLLSYGEEKQTTWNDIRQLLLKAKGKRAPFKNLGGQLVPEQALTQFLKKIRNGSIHGWDAIHQWYRDQSLQYGQQKRMHALASLWEISGMSASQLSRQRIGSLIQEAIATNRWIETQLIASRTKDYQNLFRKMIYDNENEMNEVMGSLRDNTFIKQYKKKTENFEEQANRLLEKLGTSVRFSQR
ncbi:MAG: DUF4954 family protein [Sphingomonadales bacterium]